MKVLKAILIVCVFVVGTAFTINTIDKGYEIGDVVEDFSLKNIDDKNVSLKGLKNVKGAILVFTCNHCPYSKMYEDRIIALDKKYKALGYPVIAINPNDPSVSNGDDFASMKQRAEVKEFTFPYLFDEGQKVYPKFGATRTPHVFILNKKKDDFVLAYIGAIDDNARDEKKVGEKYVEDAVNTLLEGKELTKTKTKAIGCSIKTAS